MKLTNGKNVREFFSLRADPSCDRIAERRSQPDEAPLVALHAFEICIGDFILKQTLFN